MKKLFLTIALAAAALFPAAASATQQPYNGTQTPWAIASSGTTTISALNFDSGGEGVSWHDSDSGNNGTQSRTGIDVDIAPSGDALGWVNSGEWVEYTINVSTAGDYTFSTKEGEQFTGRTVTATFEQSGSVYTSTGAIAVPVSGDWATHISTTPVTVHLNAGVQVVRLTFGGADNQDVESFSLTASGNTAPVANADSYTTAYNLALTVDPRANDTDANNDTLTVTAVGSATHGTTSFTGTSVTYTPTFGYTGADSFTYTIIDGHGGSATGTVNMTVTVPTQQPYNSTQTPWAIASSGTTTVDAINFDSGGEGVSWHDNPGLDNGSQTLRADTDVEIAPTNVAIGWTGPGEWIEYTINVAQAGTYTFKTSTSTQYDGAYLTATFEQNGSVYTNTSAFQVPNNNDWYHYVSSSGVSVTLNAGVQVVRLTFSGNRSDLNTFSLTMTASSNSAPSANNDTTTTAYNTAKTIDPRSNDTDVDGDSLTITAVGSATHGTTSFTGTSVTYTPTSGYSGSDSFTYTISDGHSHTATGTVSVTVSAATGQQPYNGTLTPWAIASTGTTTISALNFDSGGEGVAWHDSDAGNNGTQSRTGIDVDIAPSGTAIGWVNSGEWVEYTINVATAGDYSFTTKEGEQLTGRTVTATFEQSGSVYTTSGAVAVPVSGNWDTHINSSPVTVHLNAGVQVVRLTFGGGDNQDVESFSLTAIAGSNTAPVANTDSTTTAYNTAKTLDPRSNDTDADGDTLTITAVGSAAHGTTGFTGTSVTYTPNSGYSGSDSFTYTISDGHSHTATGTVNITVSAPSNTAPVANNDSLTTAFNTAVTFDPRSNDTDADHDTLTVTGVGSASHGWAVTSGTAVTYTPNSGYSGGDSFTYSLSDGHGGTASATISITVSASTGSTETVLSVTQISYDAAWQPTCTAVRMNPAAFATAPADACTPGTPGGYGNDRITRTVYDNAGQVTEVDQAWATPRQRAYARYTYSNNGQKTSETDANGNRTMYVYDGYDRLSQVQYPSTTLGSGDINTADFESFGYDNNGNKTSWRRRNGKVVGYTYDALNRQTFMDVPVSPGNANDTDMDVYTLYDVQGHVLSRHFGSTTGPGIAYAYDGLGRLSSSTDMNGKSVTYGYNVASLRTAMTFHDSVVQSYAYDAANRLTSTGVTATGVAASFTYDDLGRLINLGRSNGTHSGFGYDNFGRLIGMSHDLTGTSSDITWGFDYNPVSQIVSLTNSTDTYEYKETANSAESHTFNGLNQDAGIAAVASNTGFDANGNLQKDGSRVMTYDVFNRLISLTGTGVSLSLSYDPEGRLYKTVSNGTTTLFYYDGTNLIGEYDGSGTLQRRYMFTLGVDQPWVQFNGTGTAATDAKFLYANYQGSIIALADSSGTVSASDTYKYGPYGEPHNGSDQETWSGSRFRYTGQTIIPEARLYYYKARVYDPVMGRFLQTDPIGTKDDLDLYAYTADDPVNHSDPTGLIGGQLSFDVGLALGPKDGWTGGVAIAISYDHGQGDVGVIVSHSIQSGGIAAKGNITAGLFGGDIKSQEGYALKFNADAPGFGASYETKTDKDGNQISEPVPDQKGTMKVGSQKTTYGGQIKAGVSMGGGVQASVVQKKTYTASDAIFAVNNVQQKVRNTINTVKGVARKLRSYLPLF